MRPAKEIVCGLHVQAGQDSGHDADYPFSALVHRGSLQLSPCIRHHNRRILNHSERILSGILLNMPLTDTERDITKAVVQRFLAEDKPTPHKLLLRWFREPKSLERLVRTVVLAQIGNREAYLPKVLAFHYCGDEQALREAKNAVTVVLRVLHNLFEVDWEKDTYTPADVEQHAQKMYDLPPSVETINLGLFLLPEFANVLSTCGFADGLTKVTSFTINDNFVTLKNVEEAWDEHVRRQSVYVENGPEAIEKIFEQEAAMEVSSILRDKPDTHGGPLVLISHSSKDVELATALIELLKSGIGLLADQIRCSSVDGYRLPVGVNTERKLREEVNAAAVVVGLITPNSLSSYYVMFELGARWGANLFVAPLLAGVEASKLSGPLSLLNALSASNDAQLHQLLADIGNHLGLRPQSAASYLRNVTAVKTLADAIANSTIAHPVATDSVKQKLRVTVSAEGNPPSQILRVMANRPIEVSRVEYMLSSEATVASQDVSMQGDNVEIPIDDGSVLKLWNTPRADRNHYDHSGPAKIAITISADGDISQYILPVQMEAMMQNNTAYRKIVGSKTYYGRG